jgi:hypothetical protein
MGTEECPHGRSSYAQRTLSATYIGWSGHRNGNAEWPVYARLNTTRSKRIEMIRFAEAANIDTDGLELRKALKGG